MDDLIRKAMESDALAYLETKISDIDDMALQCCCREPLDRFVVKQAPASHKYHQAYPGGLLVHIREVMELAYRWQRPDFDWDVVVAAIIWHDVGKIYTYQQNFPGGEVKKTVLRSAIGHPVLSAMDLGKAAVDADVDDMLVYKVAHCVLSHHGRIDWQCPIPPQTKEAWLVHFCDYAAVRAGIEPVILHPDEEDND